MGRPAEKQKHTEGELYKSIAAHGATFNIYYGYYDDTDRQNPEIEPVEMYPDFINRPEYTADGIPFVTAMQKKCIFYVGEDDDDNTCYQCIYYERCEELLGICKCKSKLKKA